ncbi:MAG: hypothetical protein R3C24_09185 [Cyanobacteriota/Melainabacteria group bacterium]
MTDNADLLSTGHWWEETYIGLYVPPISLKKIADDSRLVFLSAGNEIFEPILTSAENVNTFVKFRLDVAKTVAIKNLI